MIAPIESQPPHVRLDRVDEFLLLLGGVGVIETQVAVAAEFLRDAKIQANRLGVAQMEITVGFWRESSNDGLGFVRPPDPLGSLSE